MKFQRFLREFRDQPVIDSKMLAPFGEGKKYGAVQLSRWGQEGKVTQLRRGYYLLTPPYRKQEPSLLYMANALYHPSYVSLEMVLAKHGMIPEGVVVATSVTTRRPTEFGGPLGQFQYRHVKRELFFGYYNTATGPLPTLVAYPEKALLDLIYFTPGPITKEWMREMRFQNLEGMDMERLVDFAKRFKSQKISQAVALFLTYRNSALAEFETFPHRTKT